MSDTTDGSRSEEASGRFVLRIAPGLHGSLRQAARQAGLSLNDYCARKLASPASEVTGAAAAVVTRAASLLGPGLVSVVVFGSWARDQLREESDVDVLIIAERRARITRGLYRRWDAEPLSWSTRRVEPHFVHLP